MAKILPFSRVDAHFAKCFVFLTVCVTFLGCQKSTETQFRGPTAIQWPFAECPNTQDQAQIDAGHTVYMRRCASCHFPTGEGLGQIFPPLRHHAARIANSEAGRRYLMHVLLFGLQGKIDAEGTWYESIMPAHGPILSDAQIAEVLSYVTYAWDNCRMYAVLPHFDAIQVATIRKQALSAEKVRSLRPELAENPPKKDASLAKEK